LGHAEKGSKMNFAMEPFPAGRERCFADSGWQGGLVPLISASRPPLLCRKIAFRYVKAYTNVAISQVATLINTVLN
jgi:hypothetical protein